MNRKKKIGVLFILVGIGIPLVLYFFQEDGVVFTISTHKNIQRNLTTDEIGAFREISRLKKELSTLEPGYTFIEPPPTPKKGEWYFELPHGNIPFNEYVKKVGEYEGKFVSSIKAAYAANHFENEAWTIDSIKRLEIPYRQIVGIGVLFTITGLGFLIFSTFLKK